MPDEVQRLRKELAQAHAEIEDLRLRLSNVVLILKKEMLASGSLAKPAVLPTNEGEAAS